MIDTLITALSKELELSAEEIADTIWLALQIQESQSESTATQKLKNDLSQPSLKNEGLEGETLPETPTQTSDSRESASKQSPDEQKAGIYPRNQQETLFKSELSFKVPDAPSLREPLTLARALKPLMRRIPSGTTLVLDEAATTQRIANEGLWLPVLRPTLEPWLDLELVVDEGISMQIWRHTIRELERLLKNYGIFRDVRVWGLIADNLEQVQIRRGIGATAKNQSPRSPAELIDPSGRRLVLVVSDCVSSLWRDGKVTTTLEIWAKQGSMAIVQMLPKWLWKRTALGRASEVRLQGLNPGDFNQKLIAKEVSLWDELEEMRGVKVPVFTLEPDKVATWAQMLSGKGSIWTSGYVFKLDPIPVNKGRDLFNLNYGQQNAEQRVQAFRVTASPMARKLAGLLAAAPAISLPIVRLIQRTLLKESQQVHVAEVFLGGLLRPLSEINAETNPDYVQYEFMDGVRDLLVHSVPSGYVLNVVDEVSKYVARKVGLSLEKFAAVLRNPQQVRDSNIAGYVGYFATVTAQILRRLGGEYDKFADSLENNITIDNFQTEFEHTRHFIGQEGNTSIYSICTDKPWYLPFDALVIPSGTKIGLKGSFAQSFQRFVGEENFSIICNLINQAMNESKQSAITPESPLLVFLPSTIKSYFPQTDSSQSNKFLVFATVEDLEPSIAGAFKAAEAIIFKIADRGIARVVLPLLGTGRNNLLVNKVAIAMLSAITQSLKNLSSNPIKEIIFVEPHESAIEIINQVAQSLLEPEDIDKVELLSEAGIDYIQLRNLLEAGKWREADEETARLMFKIADREEEGWLRVEEIEQFPSDNLQTIDRLWVKYSNGKFGFSVQKLIYQSLGGTKEFNQEITESFWGKVGWVVNDLPYWSQYDNLTFDLSAPTGHLPIRYDVETPSGVLGVIEGILSHPDLEINYLVEVLANSFFENNFDDIKHLISEQFKEQEYEFTLNKSPEDYQIENISHVSLAEDEEIEVKIINFKLEKKEKTSAFFDLDCEIKFSAIVSYYDWDSYIYQTHSDVPEIEQIYSNQIIQGKANILVCRADDIYEIEEITLKLEQPIIVHDNYDNLKPIECKDWEDDIEQNFVFLELQSFEFQTITIDSKGEIIKNETKTAKYFTENLPNNIPLEMVEILGGTFVMGSPEEEGNSREKPQHEVIVQPFFMDKYLVTQAQWRAVSNLPIVNRILNPDPSHYKGDNRPVENVSWNESVEFCHRLSQHTGKHYRLPSEAEWEYACRAGTSTPFHFGETLTPNLAIYASNRSDWHSVEYNSKNPTSRPKFVNNFGLFDMHGTLWEWCADAWHNNYEGAPLDGSIWLNENYKQKSFESQFVVRGGSWGKPLDYCRSAYRDSEPSDYKSAYNGFRIVSVSETNDNDKEEIFDNILDGIITENPQIFELLIKAEIHTFLIDRTIDSLEIPDDNNEATITGVGEPYDIELEAESTENNGRDSLFIIRFNLTVECELSYYIFKADYYTIDDEKIDKVSISDWNEHYFRAEESYPLNVEGLISVKCDSRLLELSLISNEHLLAFLEKTDISINEIAQIEINS